MKTRIVVNKPKNKTCEICKKEISLYALAAHIKYSHQMTSDEYVKIYGEFRKPKRAKNPSNRNINQLICGICGMSISSVGMFTHLRDSHDDMTPDLYVLEYGEYRPSKLREMEYQERLNIVVAEEKQTCVICNKEFASGNLLGGHIKRDHLLSKRDYVLNYVFKGVHPKCQCGCDRNVKILYYHPYKVDYVTGHNSIGENNSMYGKHFSAESKMKMSEKAIIRVNNNTGKKIDTKPELDFKEILDKLDIKYIHPYNINLGQRMASIDFYLTEKDMLVEIDGEYWHPEKLEKLNFHILPNVISDKQKENIKNLYRLRENKMEEFKSYSTTKDLAFVYLSSLKNSSLRENNNIPYKQKIVNKEYFKLCLDKKGSSYTKSYSWLLLKFIQTFQPTFPYPDLEEENLQEVINKIKNYDTTNGYNSETKEFSNNISTVGHNWLKHHFHSYWKSKFNGNLSPEEAWLDEKIMSEVIDYRIGLNNSNEIFDFSLHQLVRGLSARRITVSFFKPLLAATIYKQYLKEKIDPVILDPCCGFGGRLLGFKSMYPNGKYVGCEPNIETYNELTGLVREAKWDNVEIYNCKFEDFANSNNNNFDLIFTSIPYYNVEIYSNNIEYKSFEEWKSAFIHSIENCKKYGKVLLINTTEELANKLGWNNKVDSYILSNRSHFDTKTDQKKELIVSL